MQTEQKMLTKGEAAKYLGMGVTVFSDWCKARKIRTVPFRPGKKSRRFLLEDLDAFREWLKTDEANEVAANFNPMQSSERTQ